MRIHPSGQPLPPPAPGMRHVSLGGRGTLLADDALRARVDRVFHWPMMVLALAMLPLIGVEFMADPPYLLEVAVRAAFAVIWLAFVVEFGVKFAIAESRMEYVRLNWLDLIIILVPFIQPLRLTRALRVFKLRGAAVKLARTSFATVVGLEATSRMMQRMGLRDADPEPESMTRNELHTELRARRAQVVRWQQWYDDHADWVQGQSADTPAPVAPVEQELDPS